ncbi:FeS cluster assembly protein SufD [Porphyromonas levii]|uniref:Fe-S cluster assembly protein SufD n=1 Tax=Porphyromonas levii TaxID=28114 RepID=UPI001B8BBA01|nr:Fe-S cluster assembly protein SufD [Porphyromonas levii]MBR8729982.1 FeS cluster assembly protein SufD [Porphyromonas levii]
MMKRSKRKEAQLALAEKFLSLEPAKSAHPVLQAARAAAREQLASEGLPIYREEHYQYFKIDEALSQEWKIESSPRLSKEQASGYSCRLTYPDARQNYLIGGVVAASDSAQDFFAGSLSEFASLYPGVAERYYGRMASVQKSRLARLNTLFVEDLFVFYLPKGTKVQAPVHLIHYATTAGRDGVLTFPRVLVIAEEGAEGQLLLCDHDVVDTTSAYVGVVEIYAERGAKVQYYNVEESDSLSLRIMETHIHQEADSQVLIDNITVHNGRTRNNYFCDLAGEHAHLDLDGLGVLDDDKVLDNWSEIRHSVANCTSDELFKYSMNDTAIGSFSGMIYVARDAQKTAAFQNNRNLLLSDTAKMFSKPQLEIYADDVKCSHGMTTGELDEQAVFYMQQRGIPRMEARLILTVAFMADVLDNIEYEPLRQRLVSTLDNRYRGLPATCKQ